MSDTAADTLLCACPSCMTRFRVSEELLRVAAGRVRCGACLAVFDGRAHLHQRRTGQAEAKPRAVGERVGCATEAEKTSGEQAAPDSAVKPPSIDQRAIGIVAPAQAPPATPTVASGSRAAAWALPAASIAASLLLIVNVLALQYESWSRAPPTRGIYEAVCAVAGCELSPFRSLAEIRVQTLASDRPGAPEPLTLALEFTNEALFAQPFPLVLVRFADADGKRVAGHRAEPADYLDSKAEIMRPKQASRIALRVEDPGPAAVAYSLVLL